MNLGGSAHNEEKEESGRMKMYKNQNKNEDMRRRRTECSVEIRKQKGLELLMKRRNIHVNDEEEENEVSDSEAKPVTTANRMSNDEVKQMLMNNPSLEDMIKCFESIRRNLSKTKNPPIDEVIKNGLLQALVQGLSVENDTVRYESAWAITNIVSGTSEQTIAAVEAGATAPLVALTQHNNTKVAEQALWAVANIAGDSSQLRDHVIENHGVEALMRLVDRLDSLDDSFARNLAWAYSNMCRHKSPHAPLPVLAALSNGLAKLVQHRDKQVRQDACWAVSYLTDGSDEQIELARASGVLPIVAKMLDEPSELGLLAPALRTLGNVATGNDDLTQSVIQLGTLEKMISLFSNVRSSSIHKECTWLISNVIAGTQEQIQAVIDAGLIPFLVGILKSGEYKAQFEASWAVSNLTQGGTAAQIMSLVTEDAIPALCSLLQQSNTELLVNALETLHSILQTAQNSYPHTYETIRDSIEECDGLAQIENLQSNQSEKIYAISYRIVSEFFADDDENVTSTFNEETHDENEPPKWQF